MQFFPIHADGGGGDEAEFDDPGLDPQDDQTDPSVDHDFFTDPTTEYQHGVLPWCGARRAVAVAADEAGARASPSAAATLIARIVPRRARRAIRNKPFDSTVIRQRRWKGR